MNLIELANLINGRQYGLEITSNEINLAKAAGFVIVFGASDDLMEFRGAIDDELNSYNGVIAYLHGFGLLENDCENEECPYFKKMKKTAFSIEQVWDSEGYSWVYKTEIPHEIFDIYDGTDKYCRGIVFDLAKLTK